MSGAVCYRCEWEGRTTRSSCPRCGATLYRPGGRAADRRGRAGTGSTTSAERGRGVAGPTRADADVPRTVPAGPRRSAPWPVLVIVGVVGLGLAWFGLRPDPGSDPAEPPPALTGRLVYARAEGSQVRLMVLDLSTGEVEPGALLLPRLVALAGSPDHLLAVARRNDGTSWLLLLEGVGSRGPRVLGRAQLVALSPGGSSALAVGVAGRAPGARCPFVSISVPSGSGAEVHRHPGACSEVTALALARDRVFFERTTNAGPEIVRFGGGLTEILLPGYELLGTTPGATVLASPTDERIAATGASETVLYRPFRGFVDYRSGDDDLVTEHVVAWSRDGFTGAVVGSVGGRAGLWLIDTGQGGDRRSPVPLGPRTDSVDLGAAFGPATVVFASVDGDLYAQVEGELLDVPLPAGAGIPVGPIVWLP